LIYLFNEQRQAHLACSSGVDPNHPIAPAVIDPKDPNSIWPADELRDVLAACAFTPSD
jgi:hypothetical protein